MKGSAKVTSCEAVAEFRPALIAYAARIRDVLDILSVEVGRAQEWIEGDRGRHWPEQVRRGWDDVSRARIALAQCRANKVGDHEPSCYEEQMELRKAEQRLRHAEDRVEAVRHWRRTIHHEVDEFRATLAPLRRLLEADVPEAVAELDRLLAALERYLRVAPPARDLAPAADPPAEERTPEK